jgi:hypothetical protein
MHREQKAQAEPPLNSAGDQMAHGRPLVCKAASAIAYSIARNVLLALEEDRQWRTPIWMS